MSETDSHSRSGIGKARWVLALAVLTVGLAACGTGPGEAESELSVIATTGILGDVVSNVVGDSANVEVLMPAGADPHDFSASSQQIAALSGADLVVANGLMLEEGLLTALEAAAADGIRVLEVAPELDPIVFGGTGACEPDHDDEADHDDESAHDEVDADHDHAHGSCDPHVWHDPQRMAQAARLIAAELEEIDASGEWAERADDYAAELTAAEEEIVSILASVPADRRLLVTNHDSMGYFAQRYGFEVIGVVVPGGSTLGDPSSAELAALVATMSKLSVDAIFTETTRPDALVEAVASELDRDVEIVELYTGSLGEPDSDAATLIGMLKVNAERVAGALS